MKRNKRLKRILMGGIGFAMAMVVFFVGSMQNMHEVAADIRVFDRITEKYPKDNSFNFNILEIVPTDTTVKNAKDSAGNESFYVNENAEIGYFLPYGSNQPPTPTANSYGAAVATPFFAYNDAKYPDVLYKMRNFGLIKPNGADASGEYPIYATLNGSGVAVFSNYQNDSCSNAYAATDSFVKGVYSMGTGLYNIMDGYAIDDEGNICSIEQELVSGNSVSSGSLSDDSIEPVYRDVLVPVDDINEGKMQLPYSETLGKPYLTYVPDGTGNVVFTRSEAATSKKEYWGYTDQKLYYMQNQNAYFHNSSFFKEYVFGSKKTGNDNSGKPLGYGDKKVIVNPTIEWWNAQDQNTKKYSNRSNNIAYNVVQGSKVSVAQIQAADLIYISGTDARFSADAASDISTEVLLEIYNQEVNNHKAVIMDYACYGKESTTNISKLATLLWRDSQSEIRTNYANNYTPNTDNLANINFMAGNELKKLKESMISGAEGNFVTGNVYVYNHKISLFDNPKALIDCEDMFANGDFNNQYKASVVQTGFSSVLGYISVTNKNSTTGSMLPSVTPAVAVQYILISDGNPLSVVKTTLNVLEIQPTNAFIFNEDRGTEEYGYLDDDGDPKKNRDHFVETYLNGYYDDKEEFITFTSMSVDEFNGRNEDLIETYDIIYIGSEMGGRYYTAELDSAAKMNTGAYAVSGSVKKQLPSYTDSYMNGNVYYTVGDIVTVVENRLKGFLEEDTAEARFGGRDITHDKLTKLKAYLDSQKLILVAEDLVGQTSAGFRKVNPTQFGSMAAENVDHGRIDNSSNMYELMMYALGYRFNYDTGVYENRVLEGAAYPECNNLVGVGDIENGFVKKAELDQYVASEKLVVTMLEQPKEYSYGLQENSKVMDPNSVVYMEEEANGTRRMTFDFIISSETTGVAEASTYCPHLYVDVNNDGKFSKTTEDVRDMQVVVKATGAEAERDANNNYILYKDMEYRMTRELDEEYSGYIKWKISIQSDKYVNAHASVQGSTVVKNQGENELIKILQITRTTGSTLNLEAQENDPKSLYGKYLDAVPGYDVEIRTVTLDEFTKDFDKKWGDYKTATNAATRKTVEQYALDYFSSVEIVKPSSDTAADGLYGADMLVLGFGDDFPSIQSEDAVRAIQSYMENEKPVLMAHDFIMYWAYKDMWGGTHNHGRFLRNNVGMDKYGVTQNIASVTTGSVTVNELVNATTGQGLNLLHSGKTYSRKGNKAQMMLIEQTGKAIAYAPGYERGSILKNTQGFSNSVLMRWRTSDRSWNSSAGAAIKDSHGGANYQVEKMNDGQITSYPYNLPDSFEAKATHGQYFQLDLDVDDDNDGESDVVVWYALGKVTGNPEKAGYDPYGPKSGGPIPADSYYIYNKGNITYTGAGHADMTAASDEQAQLFINTLFAAYNAASVEPGVGYYEEYPDADSTPINSITVPYDENVTGDNPIDSSVLKNAQGDYRYYFVNPNTAPTTIDKGTPIFFKLSDTNFVRGTKYMEIEYYLKAKGEVGKPYELDNGDKLVIENLDIGDGANVPVVNISNMMDTYTTSNKALATVIKKDPTTKKISFLESGVTYGFYLPLSYLNNNSQVTIYIKAKTRIYSKSSQTGLETVEEVPGYGVSELTVTKADLLDLD